MDEKELIEKVMQFPEIAPGEEVTISGTGENDGTFKVAEFKPTLTAEEIKDAMNVIGRRTFAGRHPELGKMIKCQVHGFRHRQFEYGLRCEQTFTYRMGDYELFREEENEEGEIKLVPAYRTAVQPDSRPTIRQIVGAAQFSKRRFHPHPSKIKLLLIEETRRQFDKAGFYLLDPQSEKFQDLTPDVQALVTKDFQEDLQRARVMAARVIRRKRYFSDREIQRRQDQSRRINRGLRVGERA